jgi:triacylglycerol lipase
MAMDTPKVCAPIVLVHGLLGFSRLQVAGWTVASYFPGIAEALRAAGNRVLVPQLALTCGIAQRAAQLKAFLDQEAPAEPVHLIAHSMGGLDSRYMVSRLGMAERVLSLTTVGTPHRGSAFADWGTHRIEGMLKPFLDMLGIPSQAFYDLTRAQCRRFNESVPDAPYVRYFSIAGRYKPHWARPEWQVPHRVVTKAEGPNDGVVSLASAAYGECLGVWEGDHLSLVNWASPVHRVVGGWQDRTPGYAAVVRRLAEEGF